MKVVIEGRAEEIAELIAKLVKSGERPVGRQAETALSAEIPKYVMS